MSDNDGDKPDTGDEKGVVLSFNKARSTQDVVDSMMRMLEHSPVSQSQQWNIERYIEMDKARLEGWISAGLFDDTSEPKQQAIDTHKFVMESRHEEMRGWSQMDYLDNHGSVLLRPLSMASRMQIESYYGPKIDELRTQLADFGDEELDPDSDEYWDREEIAHDLKEEELHYRQALTYTEGEWRREHEGHELVADIIGQLDNMTPADKAAAREQRFQTGQREFFEFMRQSSEALDAGDQATADSKREAAILTLMIKCRAHNGFKSFVDRLQQNGTITASEKGLVTGRKLGVVGGADHNGDDSQLPGSDTDNFDM